MNVIYQDFIDALNKKNQTRIVAVIGKRGVGKSITSLRLCEILSEDKFSMDKVVFDSKSFLALINSDKLQRGDCILWDEGQLDQYSRDFMSLQNKLINLTLSIIRPMNIGLFFTTPALNWIDVGVQRLLDHIVEPFSINRTKQINWFKWKNVQIDPVKGVMRTPFPRVIDSEGSPSIVKHMWVKKSKWSEAYEEKRRQFALDKAKFYENQILNEEKKLQQKRLTDDDIIEIVKAERLEPNAYSLQQKFGVGKDRAYRIIHSLSPT